MAQPALDFLQQAVPREVWARLPAPDQARVIRLMAQLAYHVVATDSQLPRRRELHGALVDQYQTPA